MALRDRLAAIAVLALVAVSAAWGIVEARSHRAERIIDKHIKAMGGKKLGSVTTVRVTGRISIMGFDAPVTMQMKRPNLSRMNMTMMGKDVVQAFDGETAWWINPFLGAATAAEMPDDFARQLMHWTELESPLVDYRRKRHRVDYVGEEDTQSGTADVIEVRLRDGETMQIYIDRKSHLEVRRSFDQPYRDQTTRVDTRFSDYEPVGGIMTPRLIRGVDLRGEPYALAIDTWEFGVEIDDDSFHMPKP